MSYFIVNFDRSFSDDAHVIKAGGVADPSSDEALFVQLAKEFPGLDLEAFAVEHRIHGELGDDDTYRLTATIPWNGTMESLRDRIQTEHDGGAAGSFEIIGVTEGRVRPALSRSNRDADADQVDARAAGYHVDLSEWQATGGEHGASWIAYGPDQEPFPDHYGSEARAWQAAAHHALTGEHLPA